MQGLRHDSSGSVLAPRVKEPLDSSPDSIGAHARTTVNSRVFRTSKTSACARREASYVAGPNWRLGFSVIYLMPVSGLVQWYAVLIKRRLSA